MALVGLQITLGAMTVLTAKHYIINSLHVVTGASVLVTSLVLTLRAHRARFGAGDDDVATVPEFASRPSAGPAAPKRGGTRGAKAGVHA
jgi:hypothetical protein